MRSANTQYLQEVNKRIVCPGSLKKPFLRQLKEEVQDYCADHRETDLDMLSRRFGAPEEVAEEFLSELSSRAVDRCARKQKRILCLTLAIVLTAVLTAFFLGAQEQNLHLKLLDGDFIASIIYDKDTGKESEAIVKSAGSTE